MPNCAITPPAVIAAAIEFAAAHDMGDSLLAADVDLSRTLRIPMRPRFHRIFYAKKAVMALTGDALPAVVTDYIEAAKQDRCEYCRRMRDDASPKCRVLIDRCDAARDALIEYGRRLSPAAVPAELGSHI